MGAAVPVAMTALAISGAASGGAAMHNQQVQADKGIKNAQEDQQRKQDAAAARAEEQIKNAPRTLAPQEMPYRERRFRQGFLSTIRAGGFGGMLTPANVQAPSLIPGLKQKLGA